MNYLSNIHLIHVVGTMLKELEKWSWDSQYCVMLFALFLVGCIPQFLLLRMKWKPWIISTVLGVLVILCDFSTMLLSGTGYEMVSLMESFFIAALVGSAGGGAAHFFWEFVKKKKPEEDV